MHATNDNEPSIDPDSLFLQGRLVLGGLKRLYLATELDWIAEQLAYQSAAVIGRRAAGQEHALVEEIRELTDARSVLERATAEFAALELRLVSLHLIGIRNSTCPIVRQNARDLLQAIGLFIEKHATDRALIALSAGAAGEYFALQVRG